MNFVPSNYASSGESVILSGTVKLTNGYNIVKMILTNKKLIIAGEDSLNVIPLNQITYLGSGGTVSYIDAGGRRVVEFEAKGNPAWYDQILREIAKRIG